MAASRVMELRVHGVSGTPAEELLDAPHVRQVAGDDKAGFYRPRLSDEPEDLSVDGPAPASGPQLEGYAWGGLTSGAPTRALWLLLLPFTLTNVAPRLRPAGPKLESGQLRVNLWCLWLFSRLLALSMTVLLVAALAGVGVDLIGWQCAGSPRAGVANCSQASPEWLMGPLLRLPVEHRLAAGALVPLAVLTMLWQLSGRTISNYERVTFEQQDDSSDDPDDIEPALGSNWMWRNENQVRRLRHLHLQAGLVTTLWIVTGPLYDPWVDFRPPIAVLAGAYILIMLCLPSYTGRGEHPLFTWLNRVVWALLLACTAGTGKLLLRGQQLVGETHVGSLPGYPEAGRALFMGQLGLLVAFILSIVVMIWRGRNNRDRLAPRSLWDGSAILFATMGVFLGAVFSAGVYVFATAWLRTGSLRPTFEDVSARVSRFVVPDIIREAARAYAISVAILVLVVAVLLLCFVGNKLLRGLRSILPRRLRDKLPHWFTVGSWPSKKYRTALVHDYGTAAVDDDPPRARQVASMFWLAQRVDYAHRFLAGLLLVGLVITIPFALLAWKPSWLWHCARRWHDYPDLRDGTAATCGSGHFYYDWLRDGFLSARSLQGTGGYLAVLTLLLLVGLGAAAFRVAKTRRSIGILWDLASFWPRSAHPFAAPCYAERAVPDLVTRVDWYTNERRRSVVLSAHSQGTVLSAATLFQLDKQVLPQVAFLSFGCVLRRLYARYFPAYFSTAAIEEVQTLLTGSDRRVRWLNLWRHSDYLGGQVTAGPPPAITAGESVQAPDPDIEVECIDPMWDRPPGDTQYPAASRHSNYWRDHRFAVAVRRLAAMLPKSAEAERHEGRVGLLDMDQVRGVGHVRDPGVRKVDS